MMDLKLIVLIVLIQLCVVNGEPPLPHLIFINRQLPNNSFIDIKEIFRSTALRCLTNTSFSSSNGSTISSWTNDRGDLVSDRYQCLTVIRGDGEISLTRNASCNDHRSGIWRCDGFDSGGEKQSLYIYIGKRSISGLLDKNVITNFTLHTDPRASVPEFTVSCLTRGGPATTVQWTVNGVSVEEDRDHETSQIILDTSNNSVYDNRLRVRGRRYGTYNCSISNSRETTSDTIISEVRGFLEISAAGKPGNITTEISESNGTIIMNWESPIRANVTGYWTELNCTDTEVLSLELECEKECSNETVITKQTVCTNITESWNSTIKINESLIDQQNCTDTNMSSVEKIVDKNTTESLTSINRDNLESLNRDNSSRSMEQNCTDVNITSVQIVCRNKRNCFNQTVISTKPNCTINTKSWTVPADPVTGYIIYYQSKGGPVNSVIVSGGETETRSLDGLQRGLTYNISIVALSHHLPSPPVGSVSAYLNTSNTPCPSTTTGSEINKTIADTSFLSVDNTCTKNEFNSTPTTDPASVGSGSGSRLYPDTGDNSTDQYSLTSTMKIATTHSLSSSILTKPSSQQDIFSSITSISTNVLINPRSSSTTSPPTTSEESVLHIIGIAMGMLVFVLVILLIIITCFLLCNRCNQEFRKMKGNESKLRKLDLSERYEMREFNRRYWNNEDSDEDGIATMPAVEVRNDIPISEFPDYVQDVIEEDGLSYSKLAAEYNYLGEVPNKPFTVCCLLHNLDYNRFRNIYPYDDSRVPLREIPGQLGSDYINASFISGYGESKYIAAQAPLDETVDHFWRMVWEYKINAIVMLTNCVEMGREKSAKYWPESINITITPGDILSVSLHSSTPYAEYSIREFILKHNTESGESMRVTQFHYTVWPDHGVPDNVMSIIRFIRHVRKLFPLSRDPPLLVHCSAGVGRTGTFITLDMMMQQMKNEGTLSVYQCVRDLRTQRMKMVQTLAQYEFIHHALSELVVCGETEVAASSLRSFLDSLRDPATTDSHLTLAQQHIKILDDLSKQQKSDFRGAKITGNLNKNRFSNSLPNEIYRVPLMSGAETDYINASFINGYKQRDAYIVTQGPLENTVEDFWRMMWEYQCGCIVMLCQLVEDGQESSYCYWPGIEGEEMVCGRMKVKLVKVKRHGDMVERELEVKEHRSISTDILQVKMVQLISWPAEGFPHVSTIISVIKKLTHTLMSLSSKQIVVMCNDGVVRSGTFLCIHSQLERLKTEGTVDVFQAIKSTRIQRPGIIPNTDHYIFCYEVLADYVEKMDTYHNFKTLM